LRISISKGAMRTVLVLPMLALLLAASPQLPSVLSDPTTNEGWIWDQVQAGELADLDDRCGSPPPDRDEHEYRRWLAPCRRVDPTLLRALLTQPDLAEHAPHGVQIANAYIDDDLDLANAHVTAPELGVFDSSVNGSVLLKNARVDGDLIFDGSRIDGDFQGYHAWIAGLLSLDDASIGGETGGDTIEVGKGHFMTKANFAGRVTLRGGQIHVQLRMEKAEVANGQEFEAMGLHVGPYAMSLQGAVFSGPVNLEMAHVDGRMWMNNVSIAPGQSFTADGLYVGSGGFFLDRAELGGPVTLRNMTVDSSLSLWDAHVGRLDLEGSAVKDGRLQFPRCRLGVAVDADRHADSVLRTRRARCQAGPLHDGCEPRSTAQITSVVLWGEPPPGFAADKPECRIQRLL